MLRASAQASQAVRSTLEELATLHGVQACHVDGLGRACRVSDDTLLAVLRSLGAPVRRLEVGSLRDAILAGRLDRCRTVLQPVIVARPGEPPVATLRLPDAACAGAFSCEVATESGERRCSDGRLEDLHSIAQEEVGGERFRQLALPLGDPLDAGYHAVQTETPAGHHSAVVISAPLRAHGARGLSTWGLFLPLYALRTIRSDGCADLTDLEAFSRWVGELGGGMVGTLPLSAAFLDRPFEPSPYAPVSRLFWNETYLDPRRVPELARCERAQAILGSEEYQREARELEALPLVDYRRHAAMRRRVLAALASCFFESGGDSTELASYMLEHPRAVDYARFRATAEARGEAWHAWPERQWSGHLEPGDWAEPDFQLHLWTQWRMDEQLGRAADAARETGPGLYLDLPLGVHPDGYDAWREREAFLPGCSAGAPPDELFTAGQNWGFRPRNPEGERGGGYRYFADCLHRQMQHAGVLRIDHVMGLHRVYCVPEGMGAVEGAYVRQHAEELYAVLTLESVRQGTILVGEDLGTVPPEVREALRVHGMLRMHVAQFALEPDAETVLTPAPADALASVNTHDLPTFEAFWRGGDVDVREELGLTPPEGAEAERAARTQACTALAESLHVADRPANALRAALLELASSESPILMINIEDLWLEPEPQNVPGTGPERPNWRRRARYSLEQMEERPEVAKTLREIAKARRRPRHG